MILGFKQLIRLSHMKPLAECVFCLWCLNETFGLKTIDKGFPMSCQDYIFHWHGQNKKYIFGLNLVDSPDGISEGIDSWHFTFWLSSDAIFQKFHFHYLVSFSHTVSSYGALRKPGKVSNKRASQTGGQLWEAQVMQPKHSVTVIALLLSAEVRYATKVLCF